jgi:hypothetical protein
MLHVFFFPSPHPHAILVQYLDTYLLRFSSGYDLEKEVIIIPKITGIRALMLVVGHSVDEVSVLRSANVVIIVVISVSFNFPGKSQAGVTD